MLISKSEDKRMDNQEPEPNENVEESVKKPVFDKEKISEIISKAKTVAEEKIVPFVKTNLKPIGIGFAILVILVLVFSGSSKPLENNQIQKQESFMTSPPEDFGRYGAMFFLNDVAKAMGISEPAWEKENDACYILRARFIDPLTKSEKEASYMFARDPSLVINSITIVRIAVNGVEANDLEVKQFNHQLQQKLVTSSISIQNIDPNNPEESMKKILKGFGEGLQGASGR